MRVLHCLALAGRNMGKNVPTRFSLGANTVTSDSGIKQNISSQLQYLKPFL